MKRKLYKTQIEVPEGKIDFSVGQPCWSVLPVELMRQASDHCLSQGNTLMLNYGPAQGDGPFLETLATFLTSAYGYRVDPLSLMVTGGASQALDMVCALFTEPGDTIFVEEPTYFIAPLIFKEHKLNIVAVPVEEDGMDIDALESLLTEHTPAFIYTIPAYQNPTGINLSAEKRQRLVDLSVAHNFLVVADEVYQLLGYADAPPQPLAAMIDTETVISIGSFSKIFSPALRLGWLHAGPKLLDRLVDMKFIFSGGAVSQYSAHLACSALQLGLYEPYLDELKHVYSRRSQALCEALHQQLGDMATFCDPTGGFFVWVELPSHVNAKALLPLAARHDVNFHPGVTFSNQDGFSNFIRLCFTMYEPDELTEGVRRLARVLKESG
ncbi:MAG: PLP-dependent aminotransferase family protein [Chloroflexota bacterium]